MSAELEIKIIDPKVSAVYHYPCLTDDQEALSGLERQQVSGDIGGEVQRLHRV